MQKMKGKFLCRLVSTPAGNLTLVAEGNWLIEARFGGVPVSDESATLDLAERELQEYFAGKRRVFDVPIKPHGTDFQMVVWKALKEIPYGETCSYLDIARNIGKEKACRAVGRANHHNPLPIFIPCHRVVGKDGSLTGYAGGLDMKRHLLQLEGHGEFLLYRERKSLSF